MAATSLLDSTVDLASVALVDVETSGLSAAYHRVLSVAVVVLNSQGVVEAEFHSLVDPGCDPGPVHIHGLTREKLAGSPTFGDVLPQVARLLSGRVLVAHNAGFDVAFLEAEFRRCGGELPVVRRLCTLALARRVAPPTADCRLGTLAVYYGIEQRHAHHALDDSRVLAGVLVGLLNDAARFGVRLPVISQVQGAKSHARQRPSPGRIGPKPPCSYRNPGKFRIALVQGMKVAITGATERSRIDLTSAGDLAGLDMVGSVSRHTSLLVTNGHERSGKTRAAAMHGTPTVSEREFSALLHTILPGETKADPTDCGPRPRPAEEASRTATAGPLAGRRILVLGGDHRTAGDFRSRAAELGASVAVNLSRTVTDVVVLEGGKADTRYTRAATLGVRLHGPEFVMNVGERQPAIGTAVQAPSRAPIDLSRGQAIDLPVHNLGTDWTFRVTWAEAVECEVDVVAFVLDDQEMVSGDEDFIYFNQPTAPGVRLMVNSLSDQCVSLRLTELTDQARRVVIAASVDGERVDFGSVGAIEVEISAGDDGVTVARGTLDAATTERSLRLMEVYLRGDAWRLRAVGQGYDDGLEALATSFGVMIDED